MAKAVAYSGDRHRFAPRLRLGRDGRGRSRFLAAGGLGVVEGWARGTRRAGRQRSPPASRFFAILGLSASFFDLPFSLYSTFCIEERHGFNRADAAAASSSIG